mmetsp:Transcript_61522/g.120772  ORF Transcript_61522/g.120772 Transcript_61522/m.120772 type:complete len:207 (-) Transcript_61522:522-1142(-)
MPGPSLPSLAPAFSEMPPPPPSRLLRISNRICSTRILSAAASSNNLCCCLCSPIRLERSSPASSTASSSRWRRLALSRVRLSLSAPTTTLVVCVANSAALLLVVVAGPSSSFAPSWFTPDESCAKRSDKVRSFSLSFSSSSAASAQKPTAAVVARSSISDRRVSNSAWSSRLPGGDDDESLAIFRAASCSFPSSSLPLPLCCRRWY